MENCFQNTNCWELDGSFKALVDGQNLEHQMWQLEGTTHNYLDGQRAPKQKPKAAKIEKKTTRKLCKNKMVSTRRL